MKKAVAALIAAQLCCALAYSQQLSHFERGLVELKQNHPRTALEQLTLAEQLRPADARIRNFRGIALTQIGNRKEAAAEYKQAIRLNPKLVDAYRNLGFLDWSEGKTREAKDVLSKAVQLAPDDSFARFYLGRVELQGGAFRQAIHDIEQSGLAWPRDPEFLLQLADGYDSIGENKKASGVANELESMSLSPEQTLSLASVLARLHENDRVLALLQRLHQQHGDGFWIDFDMARAEQISGRSRQAAAHAVSLAARCGCWEAQSLAGIAQAQLGEHDAAIKSFRQAAKTDPHHEERWLDLTRELMGVQDYEQAINAAGEGLRNNPRSYALRLRLGAACLSAGRYSQAGQIFRNLIDHGDPLPTSAVGLAQVLLRTGRAGEAAAELAQVQKRIGNSFLLSYFRGIALERSGKPQAAAQSFRDAVRFSPENSEARRWLGEAELESGHAAAAIVQLTRSLEQNPSDASARILLGRAYQMARNPKAAARITHDIKPAALPKPQGNESEAFFLPPWQLPPAQKR